MRFTPNKRRGFTLLELSIATMMGMLIGAMTLALFNQQLSRIEMWLEADRAMTVRWPGGERRFFQRMVGHQWISGLRRRPQRHRITKSGFPCVANPHESDGARQNLDLDGFVRR